MYLPIEINFHFWIHYGVSFEQQKVMRTQDFFVCYLRNVKLKLKSVSLNTPMYTGYSTTLESTIYIDHDLNVTFLSYCAM